MKTSAKRLMILSVLSLGLSGCLMDITIPEQITELNVGCNKKDMTISEELMELTGEHSWTVECEGKKYYCTYLEESGSDCFEASE
jgi:hypothetical protein